MPVTKRISAPAGGLRERKKLSTRRAIEVSAMALFAEQGYSETTLEQIAAHAEISPATFFRYFASKADVLVSAYSERIPQVRELLLSRPREETDFEAARAVYVNRSEVWQESQTEAMTQSFWAADGFAEARYKIMQEWRGAMTDIVAQRRGLAEPNAECRAAATMIITVLGLALEEWFLSGRQGTSRDATERSFDLFARLFQDWAAPSAKARTKSKGKRD